MNRRARFLRALCLFAVGGCYISCTAACHNLFPRNYRRLLASCRLPPYLPHYLTRYAHTRIVLLPVSTHTPTIWTDHAHTIHLADTTFTHLYRFTHTTVCSPVPLPPTLLPVLASQYTFPLVAGNSSQSHTQTCHLHHRTCLPPAHTCSHFILACQLHLGPHLFLYHTSANRFICLCKPLCRIHTFVACPTTCSSSTLGLRTHTAAAPRTPARCMLLLPGPHSAPATSPLVGARKRARATAAYSSVTACLKPTMRSAALARTAAPTSVYLLLAAHSCCVIHSPLPCFCYVKMVRLIFLNIAGRYTAPAFVHASAIRWFRMHASA